MFTTGFKYFFGLAVACITAGIVFGYTTGGHHVGPLTMGYKGGVGNHVGYAVFLAAGVGSAAIAFFLAAFRDADARAAVELLGVDVAPTPQVATPSFWPMVAAFGLAVAVVGLAVHGALFAIGVGMMILAAAEWTMDAWSDRATGDPATNKALRDQLMRPYELPVAGALIVAIIVLGISRVLLALSKDGAVWVAIALAALVFLACVFVALNPKPSKNLVAGLVLVGCLAVVVGGIVAASVGERDFEKHGEHAGEVGGSKSGESSTEKPATTTTVAGK